MYNNEQAWGNSYLMHGMDLGNKSAYEQNQGQQRFSLHSLSKTRDTT